MITPEVIALVLGIVGTAIGAVAYRARERAKAETFRAQGQLMEVQVRLKQVESEADTLQRILNALEKQQNINEQNLQLRNADRLEAKENYSTFKQLVEDVGQIVVDSRNRIVKDIDALPDRLAAASVSAANTIASNTMVSLAAARQDQNDRMAELSHLIQTMLTELGTLFARAVETRDVKHDMYPFPDSEDPHWKDVIITALKPDVCIYREPRFWDEARLVKPCADISTTGEQVRVIEGLLSEWIAITKEDDGLTCWGWVQKYAVKIEQAEREPSTN